MALRLAAINTLLGHLRQGNGREEWPDEGCEGPYVLRSLPPVRPELNQRSDAQVDNQEV